MIWTPPPPRYHKACSLSLLKARKGRTVQGPEHTLAARLVHEEGVRILALLLFSGKKEKRAYHCRRLERGNLVRVFCVPDFRWFSVPGPSVDSRGFAVISRRSFPPGFSQGNSYPPMSNYYFLILLTWPFPVSSYFLKRPEGPSKKIGEKKISALTSSLGGYCCRKYRLLRPK